MKSAVRVLTSRICLVVFVVLTAYTGYVFVRWATDIRTSISRIKTADHASVLKECREMIDTRATYENNRASWPASVVDSNDVCLGPFTASIDNSIPKGIRNLKPHRIIIRRDYVLIDCGPSLTRQWVLGFREGAEQFGTVKLIDGLWIWNGNTTGRTGRRPGLD